MLVVSSLIALISVVVSSPVPKGIIGSLATGAAMGGGFAVGGAIANRVINGPADSNRGNQYGQPVTVPVYSQPSPSYTQSPPVYAQPVTEDISPAVQPHSTIVYVKPNPPVKEDCYWLIPHGNERRWCLF